MSGVRSSCPAISEALPRTASLWGYGLASGAGVEVALPSWAALRRKGGEAECGCHKKGQCVQGEVTAMLVSNAKSPGHKVGTSLAVPAARVGKGSNQRRALQPPPVL